MEDDGTVNMRKEPSSSNLGEVYFGEDGDDEAAAAAAASAAGGSSSAGAAGGASPSLASFLGKNNNDRGSTIAGGGRGGGGGIVSVDLKELLPKQKMKFLKLDVSKYLLTTLIFPTVMILLDPS